jgi:integrase
MANIERIENKSGVTFRITVSSGYDSAGKKIRHRMNFKPEPGMTERQIQKAVTRAAADFERDIEQGFQLDNRQTFTQYAEYVLDLKQRNGLKLRTLERYTDLMKRINQAIGHLKLIDIRPQHLNAFYKNLAEEGVRGGDPLACASVDLGAMLKTMKLSREKVGAQAGMAASTVSSACRGKKIQLCKAEAIAGVLGKKATDIFTIEKDTTPLSNKTILEYHQLISTILAQAEKEMLVPYNAAAKAMAPQVKKKAVNYFQPDVVSDILDALEQEPIKWRTITHLLIVTGCRRGEIAGLKWDKIDLENSRIKVDIALLSSNHQGVYEDSTKTEDIRFLKLPPETVSLLRQYRAYQNEMRLLNGDHWQDTGFVFDELSSQVRHFV